MEPRPWPEDGATEIEKTLLRAGRADGPPRGADLCVLAALQESAPPPVNSGAFPPVTFPRWIKIGIVAVVAGGGALVTQRLLRPHDVPTAAPAAPLMAESGPPPAPAEARAENKIETAPVEASPASAANAGNAQSGTRVAKAAEPTRGGSLGEETKALDRARVVLDAHRPAEALRLLDEYGRRFPQGRLRPESMLLRLTGLVQAGRQRAAETLARELLSDDTYQPYVPRIQSLLKELRP